MEISFSLIFQRTGKIAHQMLMCHAVIRYRMQNSNNLARQDGYTHDVHLWKYTP